MSAKKGNGKGNGKVDAEVFFNKMIPTLRDDSRSKGVHVVYGGLNEAVRAYYNLDKDGARKFMDNAADAGIIKVIPCRGGAMAYLSKDAPERSTTTSKKVLDAIATL